MILKLFFSGVVILLLALAFNLLATYLNISTWYDLVKEFGNQGVLSTLKSQKVTDLLSLFVFYPLVLGFGGYLGLWILEKLI